ncbi:MAG: hypothetical protein ACTHJQ_24875 [Rhizobiaceae bacterium]
MATDLQARLREAADIEKKWGIQDYYHEDILREAADALDAKDARIQELEGALGLYANEANWKLGGPCDPNSPNFAGVSFARSALGRNADG